MSIQNQMPDRVTIVGGGISGLVAALELEDRGIDYELHEATDQLGGKIGASSVADLVVDLGADNFLSRDPFMNTLIERLGLSSKLVAPVHNGPPLVLKKGNLTKFPSGTYLGIPTSSQPDAQPDTSPARSDSVSIGEIARTEFDDSVVDYQIDPLLGGVNASTVDELDFEAAVPKLFEQYQQLGSLSAAAASLTGSSSSKPPFASFAGTMAELVQAFSHQLDPARVKLSSKISEIPTGPTVLATPSFVSKELIPAQASKTLDGVEYTDVSQVTYVLDSSSMPDLPDGPGILIPKLEGKDASACTFLSSKWPHYQQAGKTIVRITTGKFGADSLARQASDEELVRLLYEDINSLVPLGEILETRVVRWRQGLPHYGVGHRAQINDFYEQLSAWRADVLVAGAAFEGIGIPACCRSGSQAAAKVAALI